MFLHFTVSSCHYPTLQIKEHVVFELLLIFSANMNLFVFFAEMSAVLTAA